MNISFDEKNIVLQFAAISDTHTGNSPEKVQNALTFLKNKALEYTKKGLDAVTGAGDYTNNYGTDINVKKAEVAQVKETYEAVFDPDEVPFIAVMGNHDHDFRRGGTGAGIDLSSFIEEMGNVKAHTKYDVPTPDVKNGSRHAKIGEHHFLMVEPITYKSDGMDDTGAKFTAETKKWLDDTLAQITKEAPDKYVFIYTHSMIYGTVYGSDLVTNGNYWYTKDLTDILEKYPQAVTFGGHLHFPLQDERSIWQDDFTSLGCGSVQYMAIEPGEYDDMSSMTVMRGAYSISSGYLVQIDAHENVRFIRMNLINGKEIKTPFVIPAPRADRSHLAVYSAARAENNTTPVFAQNPASLTVDGEDIVLRFKAAADDDFTHDYKIVLFEDGAECEKRNILTDFYRYEDMADMKKEYELTFRKKAEAGKAYSAALTAFDSWGKGESVIVKANA